MGNNLSRPRFGVLKEPQNLLVPLPEDIENWVEIFKSMFPNGVGTKDISSYFNKLFPFGQTDGVSNRLFDCICLTGSDIIDVNELLMAFIVVLRGSLFERNRWMFRFYDSDKDGLISKEEMALCIKDIKNLLEFSPINSSEFDEIFNVMFKDKNHLTFNDYEEIMIKRQNTYSNDN